MFTSDSKYPKIVNTILMDNIVSVKGFVLIYSNQCSDLPAHYLCISYLSYLIYFSYEIQVTLHTPLIQHVNISYGIVPLPMLLEIMI